MKSVIFLLNLCIFSTSYASGHRAASSKIRDLFNLSKAGYEVLVIEEYRTESCSNKERVTVKLNIENELVSFNFSSSDLHKKGNGYLNFIFGAKNFENELIEIDIKEDSIKMKVRNNNPYQLNRGIDFLYQYIDIRKEFDDMLSIEIRNRKPFHLKGHSIKCEFNINEIKSFRIPQ